MRLVLFSTRNTDEVKADTAILNAVGGYNAISFHELAHPDYRQQGFAASEDIQLENLLLELLERACVVLHPETEPATAVQMRQACDLFRVPCLFLHEVPERAPQGFEEEELFRTEFTGLNRLVIGNKAQEATAAAPAPAPVVYSKPSDFRIPVLEVDDNGMIIERPRTPREWFRDQLLRFRRWEERFNARHGYLLKNPVSRTLQETTYRLDTRKPITTG